MKTYAFKRAQKKYILFTFRNIDYTNKSAPSDNFRGSYKRTWRYFSFFPITLNGSKIVFFKFYLFFRI